MLFSYIGDSFHPMNFSANEKVVYLNEQNYVILYAVCMYVRAKALVVVFLNFINVFYDCVILWVDYWIICVQLSDLVLMEYVW